MYALLVTQVLRCRLVAARVPPTRLLPQLQGPAAAGTKWGVVISEKVQNLTRKWGRLDRSLPGSSVACSSLGSGGHPICKRSRPSLQSRQLAVALLLANSRFLSPSLANRDRCATWMACFKSPAPCLPAFLALVQWRAPGDNQQSFRSSRARMGKEQQSEREKKKKKKNPAPGQMSEFSCRRGEWATSHASNSWCEHVHGYVSVSGRTLCSAFPFWLVAALRLLVG